MMGSILFSFFFNFWPITNILKIYVKLVKPICNKKYELASNQLGSSCHVYNIDKVRIIYPGMDIGLFITPVPKVFIIEF